MNARITPEHFDRIYLEDVIPALEHDPELSFLPKDESKDYYNKGVCPGCSKRSLYISKQKPYQLKCNRLNQCGFALFLPLSLGLVAYSCIKGTATPIILTRSVLPLRAALRCGLR